MIIDADDTLRGEQGVRNALKSGVELHISQLIGRPCRVRRPAGRAARFRLVAALVQHPEFWS
jgi:hypothetical protein